MRRAKADDLDDIPGGDSFLDIVANIVGILVLLVVVVGVRAGRQVFTPQQAAVEPAESLELLERHVAETARQASIDRAEVLELREKVFASEAEAERRRREREAAVMYVTKLRSELDDAAGALNENDRRSLETHNQIAQVKLALDQLAREQIALSAYEPEPEVEAVTVAPTPIVDGKADRTISFRLQGDRLVYVPINELEMDLGKKISIPAISDPTQPVVTREHVGPIDGFRGDAEVAWTVRMSGNRVGVLPRLNRLILREVAPLRGEEPLQAFKPGGYVASRIELLDPREYVVRLIVYADSFETAPEVGQLFRERGFRVAQSLKADGSPIGFSSDGYQAVTQ